MNTPAPLPRLAPIPARPTAPSSSSSSIPWRREIKVAVRDGLQCRVCDLALVADDERRIVRVDPKGSDEADNLALLCARCAAAHRNHPQPIPAAGEKYEPMT